MGAWGTVQARDMREGGSAMRAYREAKNDILRATQDARRAEGARKRADAWERFKGSGSPVDYLASREGA